MPPLMKVVLQRLALGLLTLFAVSVIIAFVVELLPGYHSGDSWAGRPPRP